MCDLLKCLINQLEQRNLCADWSIKKRQFQLKKPARIDKKKTDQSQVAILWYDSN